MPKEKGFFRPNEVDVDYDRDLGDPGEYPFTRGLHPEMYRVRRPTIRQFAGEGLAGDTNKRFKMILDKGGNGLSVAFDLPTLMGYDSDDLHSVAQVGWDGVALDTLADMEELFGGIPVDEVTVSMTINAPSAIVLAMYIAMAQKRGIPIEELGGTSQTDIFKEYAAQKQWIVPEDAGLKLVTDMIEFATNYMPKWNPISISGYHIREAGATAVQEVAFTFASAIEYVRDALKRGIPIDDFVSRFSFFFDIHNNFFEEVSKLRAARKLWARIMKERFSVENPRSLWCRMHTQTSGFSLTREESVNNIIRVAIQSFAGHCGGHQSGHTGSFDEVWTVPTPEAVTIALRTQQIIQAETGITDYPDPLAGSYLVEKMTKEIEEAAEREIDLIEEMGGMLESLKLGYPQQQIRNSALEYDSLVECGAIERVGISDDGAKEPPEVTLAIARRRKMDLRAWQCQRLKKVKETRDDGVVERTLAKIHDSAKEGINVMSALIDGAKAYATLGEMRCVLQSVYGTHKEREIFTAFPRDHYLREIAQKYQLPFPLRVLLVKAGLDGHDRPLYTLAEFLRNCGADVILTGLHTSYKEDARRALQEDVDVVGVSIHVGDPIAFFDCFLEELHLIGKRDVIVIGGGIIDSYALKHIKKSGVSHFVTGDESFEKTAQIMHAIAKKKDCVHG